MYSKNEHRLKDNPKEKNILELFEQKYLPDYLGAVTLRDKQIVSTFAQWLGSHVGIQILKSDNKVEHLKNNLSGAGSRIDRSLNQIFSKYKGDDFPKTYGDPNEELNIGDLNQVHHFFKWLDENESGKEFTFIARNLCDKIDLENQLSNKDKKINYKRETTKLKY